MIVSILNNKYRRHVYSRLRCFGIFLLALMVTTSAFASNLAGSDLIDEKASAAAMKDVLDNFEEHFELILEYIGKIENMLEEFSKKTATDDGYFAKEIQDAFYYPEDFIVKGRITHTKVYHLSLLRDERVNLAKWRVMMVGLQHKSHRLQIDLEKNKIDETRLELEKWHETCDKGLWTSHYTMSIAHEYFRSHALNDIAENLIFINNSRLVTILESVFTARVPPYGKELPFYLLMQQNLLTEPLDITQLPSQHVKKPKKKKKKKANQIKVALAEIAVELKARPSLSESTAAAGENLVAETESTSVDVDVTNASVVEDETDLVVDLEEPADDVEEEIYVDFVEPEELFESDPDEELDAKAAPAPSPKKHKKGKRGFRQKFSSTASRVEAAKILSETKHKPSETKRTDLRFTGSRQASDGQVKIYLTKNDIETFKLLADTTYPTQVTAEAFQRLRNNFIKLNGMSHNGEVPYLTKVQLHSLQENHGSAKPASKALAMLKLGSETISIVNKFGRRVTWAFHLPHDRDGNQSRFVPKEYRERFFGAFEKLGILSSDLVEVKLADY